MKARRKEYKSTTRTLADGSKRTYRYHVLTGRRILSEPGTREFDRELQAAGERRPCGLSGTINAVITEYKASPEYKDLSASTKRNREKHFEMLRSIGDQQVSSFRRRHILQIRDAMAQTPGMANNFVASVSKLLSFAVEREYIEHNPAYRIKRLKLGEHEEWPEEVVNLFLAGCEHPMVLRGVVLGLYTGQRVGDVLSMTWGHYKDGWIEVKQEKTDASVFVPCHSELTAYLDRWREGTNSLFMIHREDGQRYTKSRFGQLFREERHKLGLDEYVFHGLRKTASSRMAEAGCTDREIMAVTGHKTVEMVSKYTRKADQRRRASAAIVKLEQARNKTGTH